MKEKAETREDGGCIFTQNSLCGIERKGQPSTPHRLPNIQIL